MSIVLCLCGLAAAVWPLRAGQAAERGKAHATAVGQGPQLDGTLAHEAWQKAAVLVLGDSASQDKAALATTARVLLDDRFLYIAFQCAEPDTASLKKDVTQRDGPVWEDDCVEVFVSADPEAGYKHIAVNPAGTVYDQACRANGQRDAAWNAGVIAEAAIEPGKAWTATLALPLKDLEAYVGQDLTWRLNVTRTRPARGNLPVQEYSWAVLPGTNFHAPDAFGFLDGVSVPERADGVMRKRDKPVDWGPGAKVDTGVAAGGVTVYYKYDFEEGLGGFQAVDQSQLDSGGGAEGKALRIRRTERGGTFGAVLPVRIAGSRELKVAFLCKSSGVPQAALNLYDQRARDNTTSKAYRWLSKDVWTPVLYRVDLFRYNSEPTSPEARIRADTFFQNIRFHGEQEGSTDTWMLVDNFAVYRGNDRTPPSAPRDVKADPKDDGVHLSWAPATDNTGVMLYVISRADGADGLFQKVAESFANSHVDPVAKPGACRYRVLACDFEENLGEWSAPVTVQSLQPKPSPLPPPRAGGGMGDGPVPPVEAAEREVYRAHVLEIARKGADKVHRDTVVCYGDSLTGATSYPLEVEGALGIKKVMGYGYPSQRTSFGKEHAAENLGRDHPYLAFILFGTNNAKDPASIAHAMEELAALVKIAEEEGTIPVLGTIPPRGFKDPESKPEAAYNAALIETCRKLAVPCGHLFEEYQKHPNRRDLIADDGVHNTSAGMAASARAWRRVFEQVQFLLRDRP